MKFTISNEALEKAKSQPEPGPKPVAPETVAVHAVHGELEGVASFNHQLLPNKLLNLYEAGLKYLFGNWPDVEVKAIFFKDERAENLSGEIVGGTWIPEADAAVVFLQSVLDINWKRTMEPGNESSPVTNLWLGLLMTLFHEVAHSITADDMPENEREEFADEVAMYLARSFNIEADKDDLGCLTADLKSRIDGIRETDSEHSKRVVMLYDQGYVWMNDRGDTVRDLREFMRLVDTSNTSDMSEERLESWRRPVSDAMPIKVYDRKAITATTASSALGPLQFDGTDDFNASGAIPEQYMGMMPGPMEQSTPAMTAPTSDVHISPGFTVGGQYQAPQPQQAQATAEAPPHNLTAEEISSIVKTVLMRLYIHIFSKCGFALTHFNNPYGVLEPLSIADIPNADKVFVALDTANAAGQFIKKAPIFRSIEGETRPAGCIKGTVGKNTNLPMYHLYVNKGDGILRRIAFLPQNPNKTKGDGALSSWAQAAQRGHCIAMLMVEGPEGSKLTTKIETMPGGNLLEASYGPALQSY